MRGRIEQGSKTARECEIVNAGVPGAGAVRRIVAALRIARFVVTVLVGIAMLLVPQLLWLAATRGRPSPIARLFHRMLCAALGIRRDVVGRLSAAGAAPLVVANHMSWTDILVLGATIDATFVAKSDVRGWPLLGWLAALNPTLFVARGARGAARDQIAQLAAALRRGPVVLFPEGTTSNGRRVLPFRSTLFAAAGGAVQPVTLCYLPDPPRAWEPGELEAVAWDGDKEFLPHFLMMIARGRLHCRIVLHPPEPADGDRKRLADRCRTVIAATLDHHLGQQS